MARSGNGQRGQDAWPSGQTVTIREVAAAAEVSVGTVSNVLNRPNSVAPETRQRVHDAIDALGFVRHAGAALMRGGRARAIGLVVLDVRNPYFTELARGVEDACRESGHLLILCNSDEDDKQERGYLEVLEEQRVAGVLISPVNENADALDRLRERGTSVVLLERNRRDYCSVRVDDVGGGALAAEHLLTLGHRNLLFVSAPLTIRQYRDRLAGVHQALARHGLGEPDCPSIEVGLLGSAADGRAASRRIAEEYPSVTGVICGNDLIALGLVAGLVSQGIRVPQDISVVGYDDIELAQQSPLPLTTISQPKIQLGRTATQLLLDEARPDPAHAHQQVVFQPELVIRETTGRARRRHRLRGNAAESLLPAPRPADAEGSASAQHLEETG
jgi:LacI family transcriptional regulator